MKLTDHQQEVADGILESVSSRIVLAGLAGTGKTTVAKYVHDRWLDEGLSVAALAPTGKARMVLQTKGVPASTVHSVIYNYRGQYENLRGEIELIFKPKRLGRIADRLLIDETSMIGKRMKDDIEQLDIPTLWIGDHGQLKPVKSPPTGLLNRPDFLLTKIERQDELSPIIPFAYHVRNGGRIEDGYPGIRRIAVNGRGPTFVAGSMIDLGIDRLVVRTNEQRQAINRAYRALKSRNRLIVEGEEIICLMNNPYVGVVNGEIFRVTEILSTHKDYTTVSARSITGDKYCLSVWNDQFGQTEKIDGIDQSFILADYAYALTCHKMQGSSDRHIGIAARGCSDYPDAREWGYTAITRAESDLTLFV